MRLAGAAIIVSVAIGGCGPTRPPDNTKLFIRCLQRADGLRITSGKQLDRYPSADLQLGISAALDSVSYFTIESSAGRGDRRQALVFVDDPRAEPGSAPMAEATELLRRARHGRAHVRAVVLMPAAEDIEAPIDRCEDVAAPGQAVP
jgi:hypothetical protein